MNGAERFLLAARGGLVDRPPVWLMRQAGRYLPEYQTIRREHDFVACCTTPELATEISLQPWRRFGVDGVVVFCDILMPLTAMGLKFSVPEGGPQLVPAIRSTHDVARLHTPDAQSAYSYLTTTLRGLRSALGNHAAVIGFAGGPWTVATYMVAGGYTDDRATVEYHLKTDHTFRTQLYDKLIPMLADYLTVQIEAGAQVVQIFDTWAGNLSREEFCQYAQPALHALIERVRAQTRGAAPITLFSKASAHILPDLVACGSDVLSLDATIALDTARAKSPREISLQGNLDPEILLTDPETIRAHTTTMLVDGGMTGYIANLGHGVLKQTPPEHVQAFVETVKNGGCRGESEAPQGRAVPPTLASIRLSRCERMPAALIAKYDRPGPRYTSYPTAPQWRERIDSARYAEILRNSNRAARPLSLYLHLPFCEEHCTFCGCNVIITKQKAVTEPYIAAVEQEYALFAEHLDPARPVVQLHWGGGTPTYLSCDQLTRVWNAIATRFHCAPNAEIGIEVDPRVTTAEQLRTLRQLGFNRLSLGVQDFNPQVQHAINRHQSDEQTTAIITHGRALGFASINVDLIYGLPHQTVESFRDTVQALLALNPGRVACYSFAYVPWLKAQQRTLDPATLPDAATKLAIWANTCAQFAAAGYVMIGFDHFAKPDDELSQALRHGTLWRNFQGYTTQRGTDLIACGITGISDVDGHYIQNVKKLPAYYRAVQSQQFPVEHGCTLSRDDELRRHVIRELLCNNQLDLRKLHTEWGIAFAEYFAHTVPQLHAMATDGLLTLTATALTITPHGRPFARNIAMCFDAYLTHDNAHPQQYSRTV